MKVGLLDFVVMQGMIVTLDGPAGSGKSTVARMLAGRLGVEFLDTGAMYRGLTAAALSRGIHPEREAHAVIELARRREMHFDWSTNPPRLQVGGLDVTDRLRDEEVTEHVSPVAALPAVRRVLVERQRQIGTEHPRLVTEGRDQGSVVFPDAQAKFYLDASAGVRAQRRVNQLLKDGIKADFTSIRQAILARDHRDASRTDGPLICPEDAQHVDTDDLTLEQVVDELVRRVEAGRGQVAEGPGN